MDNCTHEVRLQHWKNIISQCQNRPEGQTAKSWLKENGICEQTYYRNLKVLREELCENLPVPINVPEKPVTFKKLEVATPLPSTQAAVIIRLPQATLEINEGASQQTVQAVLLALQSVC